MTNLRRYYTFGNIYFITNVTFDRAPILVEHIDLYHIARRRAIEHFGLEVIAWVVLPEHEHVIVDPKGNNLSLILKVFKQDFGFLYRQRMAVRSGRVWQLRFWDHIIRDQEDMNCHIDYIHYNPVRHGIVRAAREYPYSSFHEYTRDGFYRSDWGEGEEMKFEGQFGE